jgi:hypothetical protein
MNEEEQALAATVYEAIQLSSNYSHRSMQARAFQVGISDLGWCSERTRRMLQQETPDDSDALAAFIGTAIGDHVERAVTDAWPHAIRQAGVSVTLQGERGVYNISGHPDLLVDNTVIDVKTARGLGVARRTGPSQQQQFQRHCYAKGAVESGLLTGPLDKVKVANVWIDRAADEHEAHVHMEPYSEQVVESAGWWLDDVVYAYVHGEEARKEPAREVCEKVCGFYSTCRAMDTDVEGLLTDDETLAAVDMFSEGTRLEREGKRLKDQARSHLSGITGSTGEYTVRWTHINESEVAYTRGGYERLDIRRVK